MFFERPPAFYLVPFMTWPRVLPVVCRVCTVHSARSVERKIHNPFSFFDGEGTKGTRRVAVISVH